MRGAEKHKPTPSRCPVPPFPQAPPSNECEHRHYLSYLSGSRGSALGASGKIRKEKNHHNRKAEVARKHLCLAWSIGCCLSYSALRLGKTTYKGWGYSFYTARKVDGRGRPSGQGSVAGCKRPRLPQGSGTQICRAARGTGFRPPSCV